MTLARQTKNRCDVTRTSRCSSMTAVSSQGATRSPKPLGTKCHVTRREAEPPASDIVLVSSDLLARVCPRRRNANKPAGVARARKAVLTQFFARRPTASECSTNGERVGRKSIREQQKQICHRRCRVGCAASGRSQPLVDGADRKLLFRSADRRRN